MDEFNVADFWTSFDTTDFLGKGSYASVRRCYHKELGNVVVKCFNLTGSDIAINRNFKEIYKEAEVLFRLKHENIISLFGLTKWSTCFGFVMEEAAGYNLEDLVLYEEDKFIPWQLRLHFFKDLAEGLHYLHYSNPKRSYIHGDLKLQNILLSDNLKVKIADFGAVNIIRASGASTGSLDFVPSKQHTWLYSAPEFLKNPEIERTRAMDVYSYALMGYEIITRKQAFISSYYQTPGSGLIRELIIEKGQKPDKKLFDQIQKGIGDSDDSQIFSILKKIVRNCWCFKPNDRISIKKVENMLKNKQFNGFDQKICEQFQKTKPTQSSEIKVATLEAFEHPFYEITTKSYVKTKNLEDIFSASYFKTRQSSSDPPSFSTPQRSPHTKLMWKICDRLCESRKHYLPMYGVYFMLVWFGYRRLDKNFKELQRTREQRIQELFRHLVKDHEDGKLDDFPQRFKNFLKEKDLRSIFDHEMEPLYSEYHIEVN